jgi:hypothetical protein
MSNEEGFLTSVDRAFLEGEKEYTGKNAKQQRYERREAIAARARQAIRDFALLYVELDEHERNRILSVGDPNHVDTRETINTLHRSLAKTIAFLYLLVEGEVGAENLPFPWIAVRFKDLLDMAIDMAERKRHPDAGRGLVVDVDLTVEVSRHAPIFIDNAIEKIAQDRDKALSGAEARAVIRKYMPSHDRVEGGWEALADRIEKAREEGGEDTD